MFITIEKAVEILRTRDNFHILTHANPDGDTLGSGYGLCSILQSIGKNAKVLCADVIPQKFEYMMIAVEEQEFDVETVIAVDVADSKLLGSYQSLESDIVLCIDHHVSNRGFAQNTYLDSKSSACAEVIFDISKEMGVELSDDAAMCLYTGIATDTGCFKYSNTTPKTHRTAATLMEKNFNASEINYNMFDLKNKSMVLLERAFLDSLTFYSEGKIAIAEITNEMLKSTGSDEDEDLGGITSLPRQIKGVEVGVTIKQRGENQYKVSVRTSSIVNASVICGYFGGGGHPRAAGCEFFDTLENVKTILAEKITSMLAEKMN